jgi:hypothetical protein
LDDGYWLMDHVGVATENKAAPFLRSGTALNHSCPTMPCVR